jgi:hypothetical protein
MENKNPKIKARIIWISLFVCFFVLLLSADCFLFFKIQEGSRKILTSKGDIKTANLQTKEVQKFMSKYSEYKPNLERIDKMFADPQNPLDFIEFLESTAFSSNIELSISPMTSVKDGQSKAISLSLTLSGDFSGTLAFLERLERGPYLISVKNMEAENTEKSAKTTLSINVLSR